MVLRNLYPGIRCVSTPTALPVAFARSSELALWREADEAFYLPTLCIAEMYTVYVIALNQYMERCFPNSFTRGRFLASKSSHGSSRPCRRKYSVPMVGIEN